MSPLKDFCNRKLCRKRQFGIGSRSTDQKIDVDGFTKIMTEPPIYAFNVEGTRVQMTSEELLNQRKFACVILDAASKHWTIVKDDKFKEFLESRMEDMTEVEAPPEADMKSMVMRALESFIEEKKNRKDSDDAYHNGRVLIKGEDAWFDIRALARYLKRDNINIERRTLVEVLERIGCHWKTKGTTIGGKTARPWIIWMGTFKEEEDEQ